MTWGGGGFGRGQREVITRGERTDPRVIIGQAVGFAAVVMVLILLVMAAVMLNVGTTWAYIKANWKWLALFPALPWMVACILAGVVLFIEIFDPNYPATRREAETSRPIMPWSRERTQPRQPPIRAKTPLTIDFGLDDDNDR